MSTCEYPHNFSLLHVHAGDKRQNKEERDKMCETETEGERKWTEGERKKICKMESGRQVERKKEKKKKQKT